MLVNVPKFSLPESTATGGLAVVSDNGGQFSEVHGF